MTTITGLEIVDLDPYDDAALEAWHHVYAVAETHELGDVATAWQLEEVRALMQRDGTQAWVGGWAAVLDGRTVGAGWMRTPLMDNLQLAEVTVHVLPEHRRRGIGSAVLAHLEHVARQRGRRILNSLASWAYDAGADAAGGGSGPGFAAARGFDLALSEVQRELRLPVDDALLAGLADDAEGSHRAYTLRSWAGPVPDDLLQGWAEITSTLATEAPTGELELEPETASTEAVRERELTLERQGRTKYNTVALSARARSSPTPTSPPRSTSPAGPTSGAPSCTAHIGATGSGWRSRSRTSGCCSASDPTSCGSPPTTPRSTPT
ncbi:hypothetical protein GCM10023339_15990 [Alloalcanivorax gelatiniphagus]